MDPEVCNDRHNNGQKSFLKKKYALVNDQPSKLLLPCDSAYQDKDPSPSIVSTDTFHVRDTPCKYTTEGTGQRGRGEEQSNPVMLLIALIPHGKIKHDTWEKSTLSDTKEEPRG